MKKLYTIFRHRSIRRIAIAGMLLVLQQTTKPVNNGMIDDMWNNNNYFSHRSPENQAKTILIPENIEVDRAMFQGYAIKSTHKNTVTVIDEEEDIRQIAINPQQPDEWIHYAHNFINKPKTIDRQSFDKLMARLEPDESIVLTYIPDETKYQQWVGPLKNNDKYTSKKIKDLSTIAKQFNQLKARSSNSKAVYLVAKEQNLSRALGLSMFNVGQIIVVRKTSNLNGNQSNFLYDNTRFHVQKVQPDVNLQIHTVDVAWKANFLREATLPWINYLNIVPQLSNFLRVVKSKQSGKLMVIGLNEDDKFNFQEKVYKVLYELKRVFKEDLSIMVTRNPAVLQALNISPDDFATTRLLDVNHYQQPLDLFNLKELRQRKVFSRYKHTGPFRYKQLAEFIKNPPGEYRENKYTIKVIDEILPEQFSQSRGLILYEKRGCRSCQYMHGALKLLDSVVKQINEKGPNYQDLLIQYKVTNPQRLKNLKIYRCSVLNEHYEYLSPLSTPNIILNTEDKMKEINIHEGENFLNPKDMVRSIIEGICQG